MSLGASWLPEWTVPKKEVPPKRDEVTVEVPRPDPEIERQPLRPFPGATTERGPFVLVACNTCNDLVYLAESRSGNLIQVQYSVNADMWPDIQSLENWFQTRSDAQKNRICKDDVFVMPVTLNLIGTSEQHHVRRNQTKQCDRVGIGRKTENQTGLLFTDEENAK